MPKILAFNPNTCVEMTEGIEETINKIKLPGFDVTVTSPDFGARSLESFYDYSLASFAMLRYLEMHQEEKYDGILVACFGDPGLYAVKEVCDGLVVGIAEATMASSLLLGQRFSILVASEKAVPMMYDMVGQYGLRDRLASIEPIGISVLDVEHDKEKAIEALTRVGRQAVEKGAEVLLLGCAGMTGMKEPIYQELGVPVLDPVEIGYKQLELLLSLGTPKSIAGLYQAPAPKEIVKRELLEK